MNKIKFGLKNVHYAPLDLASDGTPTYGTPIPFPGAVSISMSPNGGLEPFYADNIVYWVGSGESGYDGDLEMARVIDRFKVDVLGYVVDSNGVLVESADPAVKRFALLFQFEGDEKATRHVFYNCTAGRASASGSTKGATITPETESTPIQASCVYSSALQKDITKGEANADTNATVYANWFQNVYLPTSAA